MTDLKMIFIAKKLISFSKQTNKQKIHQLPSHLSSLLLLIQVSLLVHNKLCMPFTLGLLYLSTILAKKELY